MKLILILIFCLISGTAFSSRVGVTKVPSKIDLLKKFNCGLKGDKTGCTKYFFPKNIKPSSERKLRKAGGNVITEDILVGKAKIFSNLKDRTKLYIFSHGKYYKNETNKYTPDPSITHYYLAKEDHSLMGGLAIVNCDIQNPASNPPRNYHLSKVTEGNPQIEDFKVMADAMDFDLLVVVKDITLKDLEPELTKKGYKTVIHCHCRIENSAPDNDDFICAYKI